MTSHQPQRGLRPEKEHGMERRGRAGASAPMDQLETSPGSSQLAGQRLDSGSFR